MSNQVEIIIAGHTGTGKTHLADLISNMLRDVGFCVELEDELGEPTYQRPLHDTLKCHKKLVDMNQKGEIKMIVKTKQLARDFIHVGKSKSH